MKKIQIVIAALAASTLNAAVIRTAAPTYAQVAGVSNQVMQVQNDVDILSSMILGNELASPYLAGLRVTFNVGPNAYVPEGDNYYKSIAGAYLTVQAPNELYKIDITDITAGAVKRVYVPCQSSVDVDVRLHLGPADHIYPSGSQTVHLHRQQVTDVVIDTHPPLVPPSGQEDAYRMVGRAQYYDPTNAYGKRNDGSSFPVQRVYDPQTQTWRTQFGFYSNSVWHTECDVYNLIPQLDDTGAVVNEDEIGDMTAAYEVKAFPWNEARRVVAEVDASMLATSGATPATNLFYFAEVPIYVYKETIETLTITNLAANGSVSSATAYPMQIHWVARPEITNGIDNAFYIPSWEKVYARDYDDATGTWTTREIGVKSANYYATYKTAPTSAKNANWYMAGANNYTVQSYPWPYRDDSNYGVANIHRGTMHAYAQKLNAYGVTLRRVTGGSTPGEAIRTYSAPTGDMAARRWAGNNWHDYQAFRELAYIQFGANAQSSATEIARDGKARVIGIVGNQNTSVLEARQDDLEPYFAEQTHLVTFTIAPRAANGYSFAWLGILNFWGSEGDYMADVTTIAQTDADSTKSIWYFACLDRSRWIGGTSGAAASYAVFPDAGYEKLSYFWAYTGKSGTFYRGKDAKAEYAAFNLVATTPEAATDAFAVNLNSSAYDGVYVPSSYPAVPASGSQYSYWMCSLSNNRSNALGPWCVSSSGGPSNSYAYYWGARASVNFLAAEGEAQSGE